MGTNSTDLTTSHAPDVNCWAPRVALITSNFWPECTGIGQVTTEFAQFLVGEGIDVRVATSLPYYPEWRIYPGYRGALYRTERLDAITIYRAWHYASPDPGTLGRIVHEGSLCVLAVRNIVRAVRGADVAYIVSPDLSHAFVATLIVHALGVPRILFVQDVMPDAAVELGMLRNKYVIRAARWMARRTYAAANRIYTLSNGMRARIAPEIAETHKLGILPNTIDCNELMTGPGQGRPFRDRYVPPGMFAVVHAGNMGKKQDLGVLLRAADRLRWHRDIHFYVFGDGAAKADFLRQQAELGLANISHFPFQTRRLLPHVLHGADALLVTQLAEVVDVVVPSKLVTAMGAGAMIVAACADNSETAEIIRTSGGGVLVPAGDDDALADAILALQRGALRAATYRTRALSYATRMFDRRNVYANLVTELHDIQSHSRQATESRSARSATTRTRRTSAHWMRRQRGEFPPQIM